MNRDLEFLFELGQLRYIKRAWVQMMSPEFENITEHLFRVAWLAMLISKMEKAGDQEKILKMALVHDITESRTGDTHYISRQYVKRDEHLALEDMINETSFDDFRKIHQEYEARETIESKIVKDADTLSVDMELREQHYRGSKLPELLNINRAKVSANGLFTISAKELWEQIQNANPHDWHLNGRNRFNGGDWKEYK